MSRHTLTRLARASLVAAAALRLGACVGGAELRESPVASDGAIGASGAAEALYGGWSLVSLEPDGRDAVAAAGDTFGTEFQPDGTLGITADCNTCRASWTATGDGALEVRGPIPCTLALCASEPLDRQFVGLVEAARRWSLDEGSLVLASEDGTLRFRRGGS